LKRKKRSYFPVETSFVDDKLTPYPDQWALLSQQKTVSPAQLRDMVWNEPDSDAIAEVALPWEQALPVDTGIISGCPESITLTLANHIYMKLSDIPGTLAARIKRMASFANPVFFKTQALRFSTHGIPRYISCARIEQGYISVPRGCFDDLQALLREQGITVEIDDRRMPGQLLPEVSLKATLRRDQKKAVTALADHDTGTHVPKARERLQGDGISVCPFRAANPATISFPKKGKTWLKRNVLQACFRGNSWGFTRLTFLASCS
jgi:hypothetical protein